MPDYQLTQKKLTRYGMWLVICGFVLTMVSLTFAIKDLNNVFLWILVVGVPSIAGGIICLIAENYLEDKYNPLGKRSLTRKISNLEPVYLVTLEQEKLEAAWNLLKPKEKQ